MVLTKSIAVICFAEKLRGTFAKLLSFFAAKKGSVLCIICLKIEHFVN